MSFSEALKSWRRRHGLTQQQFADICGVDRSSIAKTERGRPPGRELVVALVLGSYSVDRDDRLTADELLGLMEVFAQAA